MHVELLVSRANELSGGGRSSFRCLHKSLNLPRQTSLLDAPRETKSLPQLFANDLPMGGLVRGLTSLFNQLHWLQRYPLLALAR